MEKGVLTSGSCLFDPGVGGDHGQEKRRIRKEKYRISG